MRVVVAPEPWHQRREETSVFLAGGISDCPEWWRDVVKGYEKLREGVGGASRHTDNVLFVNPRRPEFDVNDASIGDVQIMWEHLSLARADVVLFWFPKETVCPITLFELGTLLEGDRPLVIGTHPAYQRRYDVVMQTWLRRADLPVVASVEILVQQLANRIAEARG